MTRWLVGACSLALLIAVPAEATETREPGIRTMAAEGAAPASPKATASPARTG